MPAVGAPHEVFADAIRTIAKPVAVTFRVDHLDRRAGDERSQGRGNDARHLVAVGRQCRRPLGEGDHRRDHEARHAHVGERQHTCDCHPGLGRVEADFLGRFPERGRGR